MLLQNCPWGLLQLLLLFKMFWCWCSLSCKLLSNDTCSWCFCFHWQSHSIIFYNYNRTTHTDYFHIVWSLIGNSLCTHLKGLGIVTSTNFMWVSSCHFLFDPVHPERSHHAFNPAKTIMTVQRSHQPQHAVDRERHLNGLKLLRRVLFLWGRNVHTVSKAAAETWVPSTSKHTKILKNPQK